MSYAHFRLVLCTVNVVTLRERPGVRKGELVRAVVSIYGIKNRHTDGHAGLPGEASSAALLSRKPLEFHSHYEPPPTFFN